MSVGSVLAARLAPEARAIGFGTNNRDVVPAPRGENERNLPEKLLHALFSPREARSS